MLCWLQINQKYPEKGFLQLLSASEFAKIQMLRCLAQFAPGFSQYNLVVGQWILFSLQVRKILFFFFLHMGAVWFRNKGTFVPHTGPRHCKVLSLADGVQSLHAVREFAVLLQAHRSQASARNCHDQSEYIPGQMESNTYFIRFEDRLDS